MTLPFKLSTLIQIRNSEPETSSFCSNPINTAPYHFIPNQKLQPFRKLRNNDRLTDENHINLTPVLLDSLTGYISAERCRKNYIYGSFQVFEDIFWFPAFHKIK